jgi:DHA3 family macrolide efflux protein-like MFS transporter
MQNKKALYTILAANIISGMSQGISMIAIPWYFIEMLKEAGFFGSLYALTTLSLLFWSVYSGALIDRYPRKNLFLGLNAMGFILLFSAALHGYYFGGKQMMSVSMVFVFTLLNHQLHYPNLYAFAQELTERKNFIKVNSMLEVQGQSTSIAAGALAAILLSGVNNYTLQIGDTELFKLNIKAWDIHEIFLLDSVTYLLAFIIVTQIRYKPIEKLQIDTDPIFQRLQKGFVFLREHKKLFLFGNASYSVFVVVLIQIQMLMAMYVSNHLELSAGTFAISKVMYSIGALNSGLWLRRIFKNGGTLRGIILLMAIAMLGFFLCAITQTSYVFFTVCFFFGIANGGVRILRFSHLFQVIPNNLMGRTNSVFHMINILLRFGFISLFSLAFFTNGSNVIYAYVISGGFIFISILPLVLYYKKLKADELLLTKQD